MKCLKCDTEIASLWSQGHVCPPVSPPPPDPALALLQEARESIGTIINDSKRRDLIARIDAHLAARAHLKERG